MNEFISIKDAISITGKSESTIRRVLTETKKMKNSSDYIITEKGITNDRYLIRKDYLFKKLRFDPSKTRQKGKKQDNESELVKQLRDEVAFLRKQLEIQQREKAMLLQKLPDPELMNRLLEAESKLKKLT